MAELTEIPTLAELEARLAALPGLDAEALEAEAIAVLGRKSGALTAILEVPADEICSDGLHVFPGDSASRVDQVLDPFVLIDGMAHEIKEVTGNPVIVTG